MGRSAAKRGMTQKACSLDAVALLSASSDRFYRSAPTRLLRRQQSPADHVDVGQRGSDFHAVQVLGKTAIAHFLEAEHTLDHPDRVLNLGPHPRFGLILRPVHLVQPAATAVLTVDEVFRPRRSGTDHLALPLVTLITPHARLAPMQQMRQ